MTTTAPARIQGREGRLGLLLVGFLAAVGLRLLVGGPGVSRSPLAGTVFAACLLLLAGAGRVRIPLSISVVATGVLGALLLCLPVLVARGLRPFHEGPGFTRWAVVVTLVAVAEELFLRGALYDAVGDTRGPGGAIVVGAAAFALLHVPLYGWHVLPLDLLVGLMLGELRRRTGSPAAPAITHSCADLAAWFLR